VVRLLRYVNASREERSALETLNDNTFREMQPDSSFRKKIKLHLWNLRSCCPFVGLVESMKFAELCRGNGKM
jgi:hypothetical protein